jgi:hypothetical protein
MTFRALSLAALGLSLLSVATFASDPANFDDFEDGTTQGWAQGLPSGQPTNVAGGGPGGAGDGYLQTVSSGGMGPASRLVVLNQMQWAGDYNGVGGEVIISMMLANLGPSELQIRIGVETTGSNRFVTTTPFILPADGVWRPASFTLSTDDMTLVGGASSLSQVLDNVTQFRVLSSPFAAWMGEVVNGTLGMDNIEITALPVELMSFSID